MAQKADSKKLNQITRKFYFHLKSVYHQKNEAHLDRVIKLEGLQDLNRHLRMILQRSLSI